MSRATRYQELRQQGHDLAWAGEWQRAAESYRQALALDDSEPIAHLDLGLALFEQGELSAAREAYEGALSRDAGDIVALQKIAEIHGRLGERLPAATTYLLLADRYMQEQQPALAVRAWQAAVRFDPRSERAYRHLADAYRRGRRDDLAAQATLALARLRAEANQRQEASRLAEEALSLDPTLTAAQQFLDTLRPGRAARSTTRRATVSRPLVESQALALGGEAEDPEAALSATVRAQQVALERMASDFFDSDSGDLTLGALKAQALDQQTRGQTEEAVAIYEQVIQAGGGTVDIAYNLGTLYYELMRYEQAIAHFQQAARAPEYAAAAAMAMGECYQQQGRTAEALHAFEQARAAMDVERLPIERADDLIRLVEASADAHSALGQETEATRLVEQLIAWLSGRGWQEKLYAVRARFGDLSGTRANPLLSNLLEPDVAAAVEAAVNASDHYRASGHLHAALDELYWALPLAPNHLPLHAAIADLYLAQGNPEGAVAKLVMMADVSLARANPSQARESLKQALEIAPIDQRARGKLIELLISHGDVDQALDHYLHLADGFYEMAQGERAIEKLNEALRLAPRTNDAAEWTQRIQRRLADLHSQRLDWRRATAALESVVSQNPVDPEASQQLIEIYFKTGAEERAIALIERHAEELFERDGLSVMLRYLQEQMALRPDSVPLLRLTGEVQAQLGNGEGAAHLWERAVQRLVEQKERAQAAALLRRIVALHSAEEARYKAMLAYLTR